VKIGRFAQPPDYFCEFQFVDVFPFALTPSFWSVCSGFCSRDADMREAADQEKVQPVPVSLPTQSLNLLLD
jgi:hypothetical protein